MSMPKDDDTNFEKRSRDEAADNSAVLQELKELVMKVIGEQQSQRLVLESHSALLESHSRKIDTIQEFPFIIRELEHTTSSQRQSVSGAMLRIAGYRN